MPLLTMLMYRMPYLIVLRDIALLCFKPLLWPVSCARGPCLVLPPLRVWSL